ASDDIYSDDARTSATAMNEAIERCVAVCPAQYQWTYKRFKTSPDSEGGINRYKNAGVRRRFLLRCRRFRYIFFAHFCVRALSHPYASVWRFLLHAAVFLSHPQIYNLIYSCFL